MKKRNQLIDRILFLFFFSLYLLGGVFLAYYLGVYHNDAVSRAANASFTIFGREPHLGAIGLVWQPLPSLLQIPFLFLLKPLGLQMLAGPIVTSAIGALSVIILTKMGMLVTKSRKWSSIPAILFGLNPVIFLYASMGSSETIFIGSLLFYTYFFMKWYLQKKKFYMLLAGFFLATAFGSRYESIPVFLAGLVLIFSISIFRKLSFVKTQGTAIMFVLPFLYAVGLWLLCNWIIKGDPLYFMHSVYSNGDFTKIIKLDKTVMEGSYASIVNSSLYGIKRIALLAPALILLPLLFISRFKTVKKAINDYLLYVLALSPFLVILVFHMYQLYKGDSLGWLRFFIYSIAAATIMSTFFFKRHIMYRILAVLLLVVGFGTSLYAMYDGDYGKEEVSFMTKFTNNQATLDVTRTYSDQKAVAAYMDTLEGTVLLDTYDGFAIPLFAKNPDKYVISSDIDFDETVDTYTSSVDWVIVPDPKTNRSTRNIINQMYPGMWDGRERNVVLYAQIQDWKIYRVTGTSKLIEN